MHVVELCVRLSVYGFVRLHVGVFACLGVGAFVFGFVAHRLNALRDWAMFLNSVHL